MGDSKISVMAGGIFRKRIGEGVAGFQSEVQIEKKGADKGEISSGYKIILSARRTRRKRVTTEPTAQDEATHKKSFLRQTSCFGIHLETRATQPRKKLRS